MFDCLFVISHPPDESLKKLGGARSAACSLQWRQHTAYRTVILTTTIAKMQDLPTVLEVSVVVDTGQQQNRPGHMIPGRLGR